MALLFVSETYHYLAPTRTDKISVDKSLNEKMRIAMNITFPALTCAEVSVDAMDVSGDQQLRIEHSLFKQRLDTAGRVLESFAEEVNKEQAPVAELPKDYCGPCFGAREGCCNSCDDVVAAYSERGWGTDHLYKEAEQCLREAKNPAMRARKGEGCRLHGHVDVNKVSGNFHITPGRSSTRDNRHVHQFNPHEAIGFNSSHIIHGCGACRGDRWMGGGWGGRGGVGWGTGPACQQD